ncbi:MAG: NAD(P)H-dependent oxidoreductase [Ilumatobacteraceae bacterium]
MKVYVVYCHPDPESFTSAVRGRAVDALAKAGHEIRLADLYAEGFDPTMSLDEVQHHLDRSKHQPAIDSYCGNLEWCDTLVFIYPTWWSGPPAMLMGWLDRVLVRGVAWELPDGAKRITPKLTNVHRLIGVTTYGSSKFINVLEGETGRRVIGRALRALCNRSARTTWVTLYDIDRSTPERRGEFLDRVEDRLGRL